MSLTDSLPAPIRSTCEVIEDKTIKTIQKKSSSIPLYGYRLGWTPKCDDDFGDGGAFPEIHILQFPRGIGKKASADRNALSVEMDGKGRIKYDNLLRDGSNDKKIIHSHFEDLLPLSVRGEEVDLNKPSDEKIAENIERTKKALENEINKKIAAAMPTHAPNKPEDPKYIKYTPSEQGLHFNSGSKQRIIKMVETPRDPMSPPRFKINTKIPRGPPSPPAPVLHSPPKKVTVKQQQEWKIPPCISNWKNPKGYTIPLDKRLASDGRGLIDPHINDKFAKLAEALYIADRKAREAVEMRSQLEKKILQKEKESKEDVLKKMAQQAREERNNLKSTTNVTESDVTERNQIRVDKQRERNRLKSKQNPADKDRDISEKIALGMASNTQSGETMYDQRLFNQTRGMDSGFLGGEDDAYNIYDQPFRKTEASIYRPSKTADSDIYGNDYENIVSTNRFVPDKGFSGSSNSNSNGNSNNQTKRDGPVQFERKPNEDEDLFQLDKFLQEAKKGKRMDDSNGDDNPNKRSRK